MQSPRVWGPACTTVSKVARFGFVPRDHPRGDVCLHTARWPGTSAALGEMELILLYALDEAAYLGDANGLQVMQQLLG